MVIWRRQTLGSQFTQSWPYLLLAPAFIAEMFLMSPLRFPFYLLFFLVSQFYHFHVEINMASCEIRAVEIKERVTFRGLLKHWRNYVFNSEKCFSSCFEGNYILQAESFPFYRFHSLFSCYVLWLRALVTFQQCVTDDRKVNVCIAGEERWEKSSGNL